MLLKPSWLLSLSLLSLSQLTSTLADTHAIGNGIQLNVHALSNGATCTPSTVTWGYELTNGDLSLQTSATITLYILDTNSAGLTSSKRNLQSDGEKSKRMVKRRNADSNHHSVLNSKRQLVTGTIYRKLPNSDMTSVMNGMFSWSNVDVPSGSYVLLASIDGVSPRSVSRSDPFYIRQGSDVSCVRTDESSDNDGTSSTYGDGSTYDDGSQDGSSSFTQSDVTAASSTSVADSMPTSSSSSAVIASSTPSSNDDDQASNDHQDSSSASSSHQHQGHQGISGGGIAAAVILPILATIAAAYYFYRREHSSKSSKNGNGNGGYSTFQTLKNRFSGNGGSGGIMKEEKVSSESNEKARENWTEFNGEDLNGPRSLSINRLSSSNDFNEFSDIMIENPPRVYQQPNRHLSALQEEDEYNSVYRYSNQTQAQNLSLPNGGGNQHVSLAPSSSTLEGEIGAPYGYGAVVDRELDGRRWSDQGEEVPNHEETGNGNGAGGLQRSLSTSSNFSIKRKPVPGIQQQSSSPPTSSMGHNSGYVTPPQQLEILATTTTSNQNQNREEEEGNDTLSPLDTSFNSNSSDVLNGRSTKFQSTWSSSTPGENRLSDSQLSVTSSVARRERDEAFAEAYSEAVEEIQNQLETKQGKNPFDDENQVSNSKEHSHSLVTPSTPRVLLPQSPSLTATPDAASDTRLSPSSTGNGLNHLRSPKGNGREGDNPPTLSVNLGEDKGFRISFS